MTEYFSQFGEDRILARLFRAKSKGVCVEVGANNGVDGSTTFYFEQLGWNCILVEPNPELCREVHARRRAMLFECAASNLDGFATLHVAVGSRLAHAVSALGHSADYIREVHGHDSYEVQVKTRRLDDILEEAGVCQIDFITIDVEGHELEVLEGFTPTRWQPSFLIIEDNTWGDRSVADKLRESRYFRFRRTGVNDWYAHERNPKASAQRRLGYYPSMLSARASMLFEQLIAPTVVPWLRRVPGLMAVRNGLRAISGRSSRP
jgi:FkbM family methyltransferase